MNDRLARGLFKVLGVLREYLPEIVVGGGWAPFLYHRYLFQDCKREPIFTRDIDLMVRPKVHRMSPQLPNQEYLRKTAGHLFP